MILFGIPNDEEKRMEYALEIPKLGSLILTHDLNGEVKGLDAFPEEEHPPVSIVFWSFRVMVALGFGMLVIGLWSLWLRKRRKLFDSRALQRICVLFAPPAGSLQF